MVSVRWVYEPILLVVGNRKSHVWGGEVEGDSCEMVLKLGVYRITHGFRVGDKELKILFFVVSVTGKLAECGRDSEEMHGKP